MNDCWSPVQAPRLLVHVAPPLVQGDCAPVEVAPMQRDRPPLLLPCQKRRLPGSPPWVVPPRVPPPSIVMFVLDSVNAIELPEAPCVAAVTMTVALLRTAETTPARSAFTAA